jgi:hypothetical protein
MHTTRTAANPPIGLLSTSALPLVTPDADSSLSHGAVLQTSLVARLLGVRLLNVEGTVLLSPARFDRDGSSSSVGPHRSASQVAVRTLDAPLPENSRPGVGSTREGLIGSRLQRSRRLLEENERELRELPSG